MSDAYDGLLEIYKTKAEESIRLHGMLGKFQGLADAAAMFLRLGQVENLQATIQDMTTFAQECDREFRR